MPALAGDQRLPSLLQRLTRVVDHEYPKFISVALPVPPPIIDLSLLSNPANRKHEPTNRTNGIFGLSKFYGEIRRECDRIEKFLKSNKGWESLPPLSTNAPYLIAVWDEVIASQGVIAVGKMFQLPKIANPTLPHISNGEMLEASNVSVKVDVVSESGRKWARIITLTASRFIRELDEIEGSDSEAEFPNSLGSTSFPQSLESSLVAQGRKYVLAANFQSKRVPRADSTSEIHFRFTRLTSGHSILGESPTASTEEEHAIILSRILKHVAQLKALGITVLLGELDSHRGERLADMKLVKSLISFYPTLKINLDLSAIIALCSEITHMMPPKNTSVAEERFRHLRGDAYLAEYDHQDTDGEFPEDRDRCPVEHARSLTDQSIQEAKTPLLSGIRNKILEALCISSDQTLLSPIYGNGIVVPDPYVEFWTTPEVQWRAFGILEKIGGTKEQARARALFNPNSDEHESFWLHSWYPSDFIPSLHVRLFPSDVPSPCAVRSLLDKPHGSISECSVQSTHISESDSEKGLWTHLGQTAALLADLDSRSSSHPLVPPLPETDRLGSHRNSVTRHTALSFLWGCQMRMTTLTANRTSVRTLVREMNAIVGPGAVHNPLVSESPTGAEIREKAAIWVIQPRSLAETSVVKLSPASPPHSTVAN